MNAENYLDPENGYFPSPWNYYEYPEKTEGWIEFQKALKNNPDYYLSHFMKKK